MITVAARESGNGAGMALARAGLYGLLARVFSVAPTAELLAGVKDHEMIAALSALDISFDEDFIAGDEEAQAEAAALEFTRLFAGPGHIAAYESVYRRTPDEEAPRLWGRATLEVAGFYSEAGLEFPAGRIPDHAALEFEAMAVLARAEADRRGAGDIDAATELLELQAIFAGEHLRLWIPALCRDVGQATNNEFFRNMAALAGALVQADQWEGGPADKGGSGHINGLDFLQKPDLSEPREEEG